MDRRDALLAVAGLGALARAGQSAPAPTDPLIAYLEIHARPDGGYAWPDQPESHLTPTWAIIGCYQRLGQTPPRVAQLAAFVRRAHPQEGKKPEYNLRYFDYQQIQSLVWLGQDVAAWRDRDKVWSELTRYPAQYEPSGQSPLQHEMAKIQCRALVGLPPGQVSPALLDNLRARRRPNGTFNHTPAADGSDGHVLNTWWGLWAQRTLGWPLADQAATIAWLRGCQQPNGGCTYGPSATLSAVDDVAYTWATVQSLKLLGGTLADAPACLAWLGRLRCADGGFGDRPGWPANPVATWYAVDTLAALGALDQRVAPPPPVPTATPVWPASLKLFRAQIQAPGNGSPSDAVDLARDLHIDLWLAKNAAPAWLAQAQRLATERDVKTLFGVGNEEYGTFYRLPGLGTYSHLADPMGPAGADLGASAANQPGLGYEAFRARRLEPLAAGGGRMVWQYLESEEFARIVLDDERPHGYAAIATHHFGNPDFLVNQPFLYRWRHRLPFVSLQDAHGGESWWWRDNLAGFVTLFAAEEPTWDGWLAALASHRVAAVRHDALTGERTRLYGGTTGIHARLAEWRWWPEPGEAPRGPWLALAAVTARDTLESPRPERGAVLRVRLWHACTRNGAPQAPLVALDRLTVDGQPVTTRSVARSGNLPDPHLLAELPDLAAGTHVAEAAVKLLAGGQTQVRRVSFVL
ncbi:MAG: prenyltransferase [Armatimonadetes bacterium]|nr:prenyltransferase [Armatimonadota bacterium]